MDNPTENITSGQRAPIAAPSAETSGPLVSVIVPAYNAGATLAQCLDSILAQTHERLEVLLLDDGSTDGSGVLMDAYAQRDPRVHVTHKANEGYGATCNRGLDAAQGSWVTIVEPDDWVEAAMYEDLLAHVARVEASSSTAIDMVKAPYWRITDPDTPAQQKLPCRFQGRVRAPQPFTVDAAPILLRYHPSIWSALYRSTFLREHGIRFHEVPGAGWADNPFLIDTLCQARAIAYLDRAHYCYREETPDKMRTMAERTPELPFERWCDMVDSLERIGMADEGVWGVQYVRGFSYLRRVEDAVGLDYPGVREGTLAMFERMDPACVFAQSEVSPAHKALFAQMRGLPAPKASRLSYGASLARKALEYLREEGLGNTLKAIKNTLRKRS